MTEKLILEKLINLEKQTNKLDKKVDKIETAVGLIAVQNERINAIQIQVQGLWAKHDESFGSNGPIEMIKNHQAHCPKEEMKISFNRVWVAIGLIASVLSGCLVRIIINAHGGS